MQYSKRYSYEFKWHKIYLALVYFLALMVNIVNAKSTEEIEKSIDAYNCTSAGDWAVLSCDELKRWIGLDSRIKKEQDAVVVLDSADEKKKELLGKIKICEKNIQDAKKTLGEKELAKKCEDVTRSKKAFTIFEIISVVLCIIVLMLFIFVIRINSRLKSIQKQIDAPVDEEVKQISEEIIKQIKENILKDYAKKQEYVKLDSRYSELKGEDDKTNDKIENFENKIKNMEDKMEKLEKNSAYIPNLSNEMLSQNPSIPDNANFQLASSFSTTSTPAIDLQKFTQIKTEEKTRKFWVGSPQSGVFNEGIYKFYECETILGDPMRIKFSFNEDVDQRIRFFERPVENINNIAIIDDGYPDQRYSIVNVEPGILRKNPNGEGWILERRARIKFEK